MIKQSVEVADVTEAKESKTKSKVKVMLITFLDVKGFVHCELLTLGQTMNQQV